MTNKTVDSYKFIGGITTRLVKKWISLEDPQAIPWTALTKPLSECTVALVSTGAIALKEDAPFDQEGERRNPWWGDPSYRIIPNDARSEDIRVYHLHIVTAFGEQDLNVLLPIERLAELAEEGFIGASAPSHYSYMGYILEPEVLLTQSVPRMIETLRGEGVDIVALFPA